MYVAPRLLLCMWPILAGGCVTPLAITDHAPELSYTSQSPVLVAVIDERHMTRARMQPDIIGMGFHEFGLPQHMRVFPFYEGPYGNSNTTLARAIQDRLVIGMNQSGWTALRSDLQTMPAPDEILDEFAGNGSQQLLVLALRDWYISINWVGFSDYTFDWDVMLLLYARGGDLLLEWEAAGRDVVPYEGSDSVSNTIIRAFRHRLDQILESEQVRKALIAADS